MMSATQVRLVRLALIVVLIALWELYARFVSTSSLIASPSDVIMAWWPKVMGDPRVRMAVLITLFELSVAFVMSVVFGMVIGVLIGLTNIGRRSLYPIVLLLYGIPQAILLPLFVLIFGLGPVGKIAFGFSHGIFPVIVNTLAGMRNVNRLMVTGAASMGATRIQQVRYVIFPHMVATVFAGPVGQLITTGRELGPFFVTGEDPHASMTLIFSNMAAVADAAILFVKQLVPRSPPGIRRENVVLCFDRRMACVTACAVAAKGRQRVGRCIILKLSVAPSARVLESPAILLDE